MQSLVHRLAAAAVAVVVLTASGAATAADPDAEARERYERAIKLYEDGAYDAALIELKRAAELRPSYKLYYNIAQVELAMNDYAAALRAYRQYLQEGGDRVQSPRKEAVQKEIDKLLQRVGTLTIKTDVEGADIYVDETLVGTSPVTAPVLVNAGVRKVTVRHPDYLPQSRQVGVAGGSQEKVSFTLVTSTPNTAPAAPPHSGDGIVWSSPKQPETSAAPATHGAAESTESKGSSHTLQWIGWGLTGALAVGAGVTGAMALSKSSALSDKRGTPNASSAELHSDASTVRTFAIVTDTLIVAALAAGGISLWLTLDSNDAPNKTAARPRTAPTSWKLGMGVDGVRLRASF